MHKLCFLALILIASTICSCISRPVEAIFGDIVISQVQINNSSGSRLVEIYNNSDMPIDITDWCIFHSSATEKSSPDKLACFQDPDTSVHLILGARSYVLIGSAQLGIEADLVMTSGLGGVTGGHVYVVDADGIEHDRLGWGTAEHSETSAALLGSGNLDHVIERKQESPGVYQDTNGNLNDFYDSTLRSGPEPGSGYIIGAIYEVVDVCNNIPDIQVLVPSGYYLNTDGSCSPIVVDLCSNIDDIQIVLPTGYMVDDSGNCVDVTDKCLNLPDIQADIPDGSILDGDGNCDLGLLPLKVSELLPNPIGSDEGNEFIEIFNPNESDIDLSNYIFYVGANYAHAYTFPVGSHIGAGEYAAFLNDDIKFTLVNTTSSVQLFGIDNILVYETPIYDSPADGMSWALIDSVWQYTNQPTPGATNVPSVIETNIVVKPTSNEMVPESNLEPCASNQYRNPETNRCKLIVVASSALTPCRDGQYRSEETNRCRSIASDVIELTACTEGQERNPETNRCRSIVAVLGASDLKPCEEDQERNPDTNRCRNIISAIPTADYAPEQTSEQSNNDILWWSLAGVGVVAIIYGIWEWRQEIGRLVQKIGLLLHRTR